MVIPRNIYWDLNYEVMAHWIMGDGTYKSGMAIQTDGFTVEDVAFIINILRIKWNLDARLHFARGNPVLYITAANLKS